MISSVDETEAGFSGGLRADDQIMSINNQAIESVDQFIEIISKSAERTVTLGIQRKLKGNKDELIQNQIVVIPRMVNRDGKQVGQLGIQLRPIFAYPESMYREMEYSLISALPRAVEETLNTSLQIVKSIGKLVTGDLSPKTLSGPITIAKVAGDTARSGFDNFIRFIAILSIMLGVMNLLPIPVLDGGHIVFITIEMLKGSPVSEVVQIAGYKIGFAMLMGLMLYATFNDLMRPF
jgi:regulator of sigma E protease